MRLWGAFMIAGTILLVVLWAQPSLKAGMTFSGKRALVEEDVLRWTKKDYLDQMLPVIKAAGFNVYIPYVWHGRGVTWSSAKTSWDVWLKDVSKDGFDPLRYAIQKAHSLGIEVHPCFTVALKQADILPEYAPPGTPDKAFDVHNPQFRDFLADLVEEVVRTYEIDGVNLDYVRAIGLCSSEGCQREYSRLYGRNLTADSLVFRASPGLVPTLTEFQKQAVATTVKTIVDRIRAVKPRTIISVDAIPGVATPDQGQDSIDWVNTGYVDVLFRMDYYRAIDAGLTDALRAQLRNPDALSLMISNVSNFEEMAPGQAHFARDGKWLAETVAMIQARWPKTGVAIYFANYLTDEQTAALKSGPFRELGAPENLRILTR
jgi:hypothetical protein